MSKTFWRDYATGMVGGVALGVGYLWGSWAAVVVGAALMLVGVYAIVKEG